MVLPGHLAGGYLAAWAALSFAPAGTFSSNQTAWLLTLGVLASEGPDLDLLLYYFSEKRFFRQSQSAATKPSRRRHSHREYITHAPLFWVLVSVLVSLTGVVINSPFVVWSGIMILVGSWSHLLLDSIEDGVLWFWPWRKKRKALFYPPETTWHGARGGFKYYAYILRHVYPKRLTFYLELIITLVALWVAFHP